MRRRPICHRTIATARRDRPRRSLRDLPPRSPPQELPQKQGPIGPGEFLSSAPPHEVSRKPVDRASACSLWRFRTNRKDCCADLTKRIAEVSESCDELLFVNCIPEGQSPYCVPPLRARPAILGTSAGRLGYVRFDRVDRRCASLTETWRRRVRSDLRYHHVSVELRVAPPVPAPLEKQHGVAERHVPVSSGFRLARHPLRDCGAIA